MSRLDIAAKTLQSAAHYAAVLADRSEREVERATGIGFFLGFGLGALALVIDALAGSTLDPRCFESPLAGLPLAVVVVLVVLLNNLDASAGIAVAALGLVAVASGAALGYFADRLPEFPKARRHSDGAGRLAGAHQGHR